MMRGLAEFIMRGRWQALLVAVSGSVFVVAALLSAAAIALVTLARGLQEGAWVALWSLLPALLIGWMSGDYGTGLLLLGGFLGAAILAQTFSLSLALVGIGVISALGGLALLVFNSVFLEALLTVFDAFIQSLAESGSESGVANLTRPSLTQVAGLMAVGNALMACLGLLLGRHWQAALYKPGAFGEEFRALRLPMGWAVLLVVVTVAGGVSGGDLAAWTALAGVPVTICGFALLHHVARARQLGGTLLTVGYVVWVLVDIAKIGLLLAVLLDAFFDVGRRARGA